MSISQSSHRRRLHALPQIGDVLTWQILCNDPVKTSVVVDYDERTGYTLKWENGDETPFYRLEDFPTCWNYADPRVEIKRLRETADLLEQSL